MKPGTHKFLETPKEDQTPEKKIELPDKRRFELTENEGQKVPAPWPTLIHKLNMTPMLWKISVGQLGLAVWLCSIPAPTHLLIS